MRHIARPLLVLAACGFAISYAWHYSRTLVLSALAMLVLIGLINGHFVRKKNRRRGWRVGHRGRDEMFYEESIGGLWERIPIDGEMICGEAHHVIYFPSDKQWEAMPEWTRGRKHEIVNRIKEEFKPPGYEYHEAE